MNVKLGKYKIGDNYPSLIVAELSGNHGGNLGDALKLVKFAHKAGANAIKLQTYTANTITINSKKKDFLIKKNSPWKNNVNYWKLYNKAHTPWGWHKKIFNLANKLGILAFSSPFDETAVDFLEKLNCPVYKLAPEINHIPLIKKIAKTKKPIIISTGLADLKEISKAVKIIRSYKNNKIIILKCTTSYPCKNKDLNLASMLTLKKKYKTIVGFSDHSIGDVGSITAVALGAKMIEKHISLKNKKTVDDFFSLNGQNFKKFVKKIRDAEMSLGSKKYKISKSARIHMVGKRSIYVCKKIKIGDKVDKNNIKVVRPNKSLDPKFYSKLIGMISKKNLNPGDRIKMNYFKK